jgi:hypothetical protein
MEDLEDKFNKWEQLDRELGAGGSEFAVPDITKAIALALLVPHEIEQQFISAPEGSLKTYQQQIAYVRQRINDDKARTMSAKTLKQANGINELGMEQPKGADEQGDVDYNDENLINALSHMTKDQIIMYVRGKGKGKYNSAKGKGGKGKQKGSEDGKGGKGKDGKGKGPKGKGKGKGIKGACWTCNEIGHRAEDGPKKKTDVNQVGDALEQDHVWEDDGFGDEDYWTVGSLQAIHQPPPGLRATRGGFLARNRKSPRANAGNGLVSEPISTKNRWTVIAPDDEEHNEPNNAEKRADDHECH